MCRTLAEIRSRLADSAVVGGTGLRVFAAPGRARLGRHAGGRAPVDEGDYDGLLRAGRLTRSPSRRCLGEFVSDLKARGLYDQSVIILTSDHGDSLGRKGAWDMPTLCTRKSCACR